MRQSMDGGMLRAVGADTLEMMSKSIGTIRLLGVAYLILSGAPVRLTASCERPPPVCEAAARADVVFVGEVLESTVYAQQSDTGPLPQGIQAVRFNVIRAFKGVEPTEWWGLFHFGVDANAFKVGARYLVFAHRRATGAFVTGCTLTREMRRADEEAWLRAEGVELGACLKSRP